jgi:hypothetical protein
MCVDPLLNRMNCRCLHILLLLFCLTACERKADVTHPQTYSNAGLEFQHPRNWKVEGTMVSPDMTILMITSPGDSLMLIQSSSPSPFADLQTFASSYPSMFDDATPPVIKEVTGSDGQLAVESHHVIRTMGTTIECTRIFRMKVTGGKTYFFYCQATDNDLRKVNPGFDLIVKSLTYKKP